MEELLSVGFSSKITPVKPVNDEMTLCKCYVMALGKNNNMSNISKDAVDNALPTLFNIPIVGHIYENEDGEICMGGHDRIIVQEGGKRKFKSLTVPYGVVPYQDNVHYEEVLGKDGIKRTYLVADIILWTARYPELLDCKYDDDTWFNMSMEIKPSKAIKEADGYTRFDEYKYTGLCLLGKSDDADKNVNPCFPDSKVEPYKFSLETDLIGLFEEFQSKLANCYNSYEFEKGGNKSMDAGLINSILAEFGIESVESLDFEITAEMSEEDLRSKLAEVTQKDFNKEDEEISNGEEQPVENNEETQTEDAFEEVREEENIDIECASFASTYNEKRKAIVAAIDSLAVNTRDYSIWFALCDFDDQYVYTEYYRYLDGERSDGKCRMKYELNEGEAKILVDTLEKMQVKWLTQEEVNELEAKRQGYAELVAYKERRIEEDRRVAYSKVVNEFSDLSDVEEYKEVVGRAMDFESEEALKEKLFALRGRYGKFAKQKSLDNTVIPLNAKEKKPESLEEKFFSKYLPGALKK